MKEMSLQTKGIVLIVLGIIFIISNAIDIEWSTLWPILLIIIGFVMLYENNSQK